ncbi:hypothetical protein [Nonomuraea rhodomycinica]|uniref:Uncharacterized protein n=1 Tax=Nonomuraea rhodomycinica TaxID=1712872 RepID=A0A7Y6IWB1_9ACTN|nr:hypothetical protein [Nonomuraea rhodomycinica]NUW45597.1 hypothetical protein [Nonomuraea rhodomycinica]
MTILADHTDTTNERTTIELAPADILDATDALQRLGGKRITHMTARDRQALTMLTYLNELPPYRRNLLASFVTGELTGLTGGAARLIQRYLPAVSDEDRREWRSTRYTGSAPAHQIITALAGYAASRADEFGSHILDGALQTAIRIGRPNLPLHEVPGTANKLIADALGDLDAAGLATPSQGNPVERALRIIAARAARHHDAVGAALRWAMQTLAAEMAHASPTPISDVEQHAAHQQVTELVEGARTDDASDRITAALATYVDEHSSDAGGGHQRTMLLAAQIARLFNVTPGQAIDLAKHDPYDDRVKAASQARDEALARARHARENADYDVTPVAVTR